MKYLIGLLFAACFTSCAQMYEGPVAEPGKTAELQLRTRPSKLGFSEPLFLVRTIDGLYTQGGEKIVLTEGTHSVVVHAIYQTPLSLLTFTRREAQAEIEMSFAADHLYKINGRVEKKNLLMWIEDTATGNPSSPIVETRHKWGASDAVWLF